MNGIPEDFKVRRAKKVVDNGTGPMAIPLATLSEAIYTNDKLDTLTEAVKSIPSVVIPESVEISNLPEYPSEISISNLPETQKVEVTNFPKQEAPIVKISPQVVNVDAPIIDVHQEEVVAELKNISTILSQEEEEKTEKVEIVDKEGKEVDFKELFDSLGNRIGNIKISGGGGGGGLNQDQLRATLLTTQGVNYATLLDDVSTTSVTYVGKAGIGSATASAVWQIMKMDESGTPTTLATTWADGDSQFNNVWDNRTSLTYL